MRHAIALAVLAVVLAPLEARADTVGTTFPPGFPTIEDASLRVPVIGFGGRGRAGHVPVIFLHGNNDTPYPNPCNSSFGHIRDFAQYFADHGYAPGELWGLGYQGDQCDLLTTPTNKSGPAHSTIANVPDLRAFVHAVLDYTGAAQVDVVGHSLGATLTREWMRQDDAYGVVRTLVSVDGPNHGIINCSPSAMNYFQADGAGGFNPDSAICTEYGSDHTPLLLRLNAGDETPAPTRYVALVNSDKSFVYYSKQDGVFPAVPAEDRDGRPHDFSRSALLAGATTFGFTDQGRYDQALQASHTGIVNSPEVWRTAFDALAPTGPPTAGTGPSPAARPKPRLAARVRPRRDRRPPYRFRLSGRVIPPAGAARSKACRGVVSIAVRRRGLTLATRRARVGRRCQWHSRVTVRGARGRVRISIRFFGNAAIAGASVSRVVRAG
jgi:pimeloyl-ACP methyl ester carboxylesterase